MCFKQWEQLLQRDTLTCAHVCSEAQLQLCNAAWTSTRNSSGSLCIWPWVHPWLLHPQKPNPPYTPHSELSNVLQKPSSMWPTGGITRSMSSVLLVVTVKHSMHFSPRSQYQLLLLPNTTAGLFLLTIHPDIKIFYQCKYFMVLLWSTCIFHT